MYLILQVVKKHEYEVLNFEFNSFRVITFQFLEWWNPLHTLQCASDCKTLPMNLNEDFSY